jgi:hypothetical protein
MSGINAGKVVTGGLLAGLVFNVLDFVFNSFILMDDFRANATRLGLDPAAAESAAVMVTWVVIDFVLGLVVVWTYAAMRPRFGPGPRTAVYAGLVPYLAISAVIFGFTMGGVFPMPLFGKGMVFSLITTMAGSMAGARVYKE